MKISKSKECIYSQKYLKMTCPTFKTSIDPTPKRMKPNLCHLSFSESLPGLRHFIHGLKNTSA
jgi:hypothetical protein